MTLLNSEMKILQRKFDVYCQKQNNIIITNKIVDAYDISSLLKTFCLGQKTRFVMDENNYIIRKELNNFIIEFQNDYIFEEKFKNHFVKLINEYTNDQIFISKCKLLE